MDAIEFVGNNGLDLVRRDVAALQNGFIKRDDFLEHYGFDVLDDLKQIVEAFELVESYGGLEKSKLKVQGNRLSYKKTSSLWKAIELVEKCHA